MNETQITSLHSTSVYLQLRNHSGLTQTLLNELIIVSFLLACCICHGKPGSGVVRKNEIAFYFIDIVAVLPLMTVSACS